MFTLKNLLEVGFVLCSILTVNKDILFIVLEQKRLVIHIIFTFICAVASAEDAYFSRSFQEADALFLKIIEKQKPYLHQVQMHSYPHVADSKLNTRVVKIKSGEKSRYLTVLISGTHGVEGFVGSALQSRLIDTKLPLFQGKTSDFLFIHALNPYGFQNLRRTDQDNIDLNRNFLVNPKDFYSQNENYKKISDFLNPQKLGSLHSYDKPLFVLRAVGLIFQYGFQTLKNSILVGQYQQQNGLFFGGYRYQDQKKIIDDVIAQEFPSYHGVVIIDLHTGYGEKNKLHILSGATKEKKNIELNRFFQNKVEVVAQSDDFYRAQGDLISYFQSKETKQTQINGVVFEFGTMDSQKILGSLESLRIMILENQFNFKPSLNESENQLVQDLFANMFNPTDPKFRKEILWQFDAQVDSLINYLNNL